MAQLITCHQCHDNCSDHTHWSECTGLNCYSTTLIEKNEGQEYIQHRKGCDLDHFQCKSNSSQPGVKKRFEARCCTDNFCNNEVSLQLMSSDVPPGPSGLFIFICISSSLIFVALAIYFVIFFFKKYSNKKTISDNELKIRACDNANDNHFEREFLNSDYRPEVNVTAPGDSTLREVLIDGSVTSGSGSGFPLLIQRTLGKQIDLMQCIGKGRYGEVWKGVLHYDEVAVKIFYSKDEASFNREVEIYSTIVLKNENILPFIGSDIISMSSSTQLWLVTTYYPLGSLFDFLNERTLNVEDMFSIMTSIASGLEHLHMEVFGIQGKPAIAHRDIKSKNILMTSLNTCCIADFGLAVTHKQTTDSVNIAFNYRVGTKRYMAPEVLDGTLQETNFQSYTLADIYSLSLVLWEIICRTESNTNAALPYNVPYQGMVPNDPSFDDMRNVVCTQNLRPEISSHFQDNPRLAAVTKIITETWSRAPFSRLSALRIKKSLIHITRREAAHTTTDSS